MTEQAHEHVSEWRYSNNPDPVARRPAPKRTGKDFWPTPANLTAALIQHVLPLLPPFAPI